ncbi:MAG: carbamoyl phosphate synthase small subunit [Spirochaetaceae bacterium 4572_59]|nr:MAG: carbamoyl phosphate synthase small subunit [Spirochaetaceae bacterium 4572_59]
MQEKAYLVLEDGTVFPGKGFGEVAPRISALTIAAVKPFGEVVFNTGMSGYHEILTDPSYTGQLVTMTYPHIGNYGTRNEWSENGPEPDSRVNVKVSGFVVRSLYDGPLPAGRVSLHSYLLENGISGISGIDTRKLTLRLRDLGSCNGIIVRLNNGKEEWTDTYGDSVVDFLQSLPPMEGQNLIGQVGTSDICEIEGSGPHIALLDYGIKANIIKELERRNCRITLLPSHTGINVINRIKPDAVFLSNGPGDPAVLGKQIKLAQDVLGKYPIVGICLGHQILGLALGGETCKMKFGHHGCNHPVRDEETKKVFVTSQNHGFVVKEESLPKGVTVRFRNANDGSIEGLEWKEKNLFCVQFHPEAAPGPLDSTWIFDAFLKTIGGE